MKSINTLSTLVSSGAVSEAFVMRENRKGSSGSGQVASSEVRSVNMQQPMNSPADSGIFTSANLSDKHPVGSGLTTPLSIVKVSPLSMFFNNKVGSSSFSQDVCVQPNHQLRGQASFVLPVGNRRIRDSGSFLFMVAFLSFLAYIIWDGIIVKEADINLVVHGHDSYGNICGRYNRPIKYAPRSGRNYTSKPYTKYTLINSQLERYTLDSDRLKHGELFYVKQDGFAPKPSDTEGQITRALARTNPRRTRASETKPAKPVYFEYRGQLFDAKNQTPLSDLKSTLMHQYPPMYGYVPPANDRRQSLVKHSSGALSSQEQLEVAASQREQSSASAPPTSTNAMPSPSTTLAPPRGSTTLTVMYDDHTNESDRYEHMLVDPKSTTFRGRAPEGFYQNEVSSQLLYLTECVEYCPSEYVELIFYRCMPKNWRFSLFPNAINVTRTFIDEILTDVSHCYRELVYIFSFALALSLALLILLRFLASIIIWSCLALLISLFLSTASYSWLTYYNQIVELNTAMPHDSTYSDKLATSDKWLVGAIFLTFVSFASIGTVIFMRKRILLVTMLFRESGKAIADMPLLLLQPLLTFAVLVGITALWSVGLICLQSVKSPVIQGSTEFVVFKAETLYKLMKWYHIFAYLWISHFAIACQHYVIGAAVSKWYFSTDRYNLHTPIGSSVSELILYYLGSVALGSFLVAIFKVIRIITRQIHFLVQRNCIAPSGSDRSNSLTDNSILNSSSVSSSCCGSFSYVWRLFIWFFDNIVMIINRDAYVEIAIHGHSFLKGAQQAFNVLSSNPLRLLAIKSVSNVLLVIAKICVVFGTVSMAAMLLEEKNHQLNYSWSPIVISAIYAYIVAHWFLSVYEMVIDALFICYCEDYERSKKQEATNQIVGSNFMTQILNSGPIY